MLLYLLEGLVSDNVLIEECCACLLTRVADEIVSILDRGTI